MTIKTIQINTETHRVVPVEITRGMALALMNAEGLEAYLETCRDELEAQINRTQQLEAALKDARDALEEANRWFVSRLNGNVFARTTSTMVDTTGKALTSINEVIGE